MLFNITSVISLILIFLIHRVLDKAKHGKLILKIFSCILFAYKTITYVYLNIMGEYVIPVEISSLSYFILPTIITFGIKKYYNVASFFGLIAGLGFFLFYITMGFTVENSIPFWDHVIGMFCHGYLLFCGLFLFKKYDFSTTNKLSIWVVFLAMISWALLFFEVNMRGITFIYYIIKPSFLYIFSNMSLNYLLIMFYYIVLVFFVMLLIKAFYKINSKIHKKQITYKFEKTIDPTATNIDLIKNSK